jgi:hypothetical protein
MIASPIRPGKHVVSKETMRKAISALRKRALQGEPSAVVAIVQLREDIAAVPSRHKAELSDAEEAEEPGADAGQRCRYPCGR